MSKLTPAVVQSMITEQTKALTTELTSLQTKQAEIVQQNKQLNDEIAGLRAEVKLLRDQLMAKVELIIKTQNESPPLLPPTSSSQRNSEKIH